MVVRDICHFFKDNRRCFVATRRIGVDYDGAIAFDSYDGILSAKVFRDPKPSKGLEAVPIITYVGINSSIY